MRNLMLLAALAGTLGPDAGMQRSSSPKQWKPEFTDEELETIRALPKKARKKAVAELRAKYLALRSDSKSEN